MKDYQHSIELNAGANKIFNALTREIPLWWTEMFEGSSNERGQLFTVRFGDNVFKTMEVKELVTDVKVVWEVKDSVIAIPELKNQREWIGTRIIWEIKPGDNVCNLELTHLGLTPVIECYDICADGWQQFINSFKSHIETDQGNSYKA